MVEVVHRLGAVLCVIALSVWASTAVLTRWRSRGVRRRVRAVLATVPVERRRDRVRLPAALRRWMSATGAGCAGYVLVGGAAGLLVGVVAAGLVWRRRGDGRRSSADAGLGGGRGGGADAEVDAVARAEAERQLPLAAELLAACLAAGADPVGAARAVGESLDGPVGRALARGAAQVRLGSAPGFAWRELAALPGAGGLVRLLERAGESGAPAAVPVARFAAECRAERGRRATAVARRAAVIITAPVGLCFLPAFLVVGVLPVVIGLAGGVLSGGGG
ncbi:type II secretion system F family protein [Streptomyces sp. SID5785]|uniref:type II secretion system F family protein n=1 Tax=Streptomyces sp. SID5785 TaxID=2690309 RepID=UPI001F1C3AA1|nr:type II secretion system F family protein [Streptomyces sp. SID5785]